MSEHLKAAEDHMDRAAARQRWGKGELYNAVLPRKDLLAWAENLEQAQRETSEPSSAPTPGPAIVCCPSCGANLASIPALSEKGVSG